MQRIPSGGINSGSDTGFSISNGDVDNDLFGAPISDATLIALGQIASAYGELGAAIVSSTLDQSGSGSASILDAAPQSGAGTDSSIAAAAPSAQSQGPTQTTSSGDQLQEIEVDAPRIMVPNQNFLPADITSSFPCGSWQCSYQMGQFNSGSLHGVWLNLNLLGKTGTGRWTQTFIDSNTGQFQPDVDSSGFYPSYASNGQWFFDDPARSLGSSVTWVAQASYMLPNQASAAFTFTWGFILSPNGTSTYIPPVPTGPWPKQ